MTTAWPALQAADRGLGNLPRLLAAQTWTRGMTNILGYCLTYKTDWRIGKRVNDLYIQSILYKFCISTWNLCWIYSQSCLHISVSLGGSTADMALAPKPSNCSTRSLKMPGISTIISLTFMLTATRPSQPSSSKTCRAKNCNKGSNCSRLLKGVQPWRIWNLDTYCSVAQSTCVGHGFKWRSHEGDETAI